jgi:hypothetical protein
MDDNSNNQIPQKQAVNKVDYIKPYQFKPGQSGNPGGRPKGKSPSKYALDKFTDIDPKTGKTIAELIADKWINQAIEGLTDARRDLLDRTEGKVIQTYQIDKHEINITGSVDDLIKLRELAMTENIPNDIIEIDSHKDDV